MNPVIVVQARMGSTRLPGKTMANVMGRPMLELVLERVAQSKVVDKYIVATTRQPEDDIIESYCYKHSVDCYRGSSRNVTDRVVEAATYHRADTVVHVTADCPALDPDVLDRTVRVYEQGKHDYVSNALDRTYPRGLDVQICSPELLASTARRTSDPAYQEHVGLYIREHRDDFAVENVTAPDELCSPNLRLTVDYPEDLDLIRLIYEHLYPDTPEFRLPDILALFSRRPYLPKINASRSQKPLRPLSESEGSTIDD